MPEVPMIETSPDTRTRDAYRRAHQERGAALAGLWRRLLKSSVR